MTVYHGGYSKVATKLEREVIDLYHKISQTTTEYECFIELRNNEMDAIPKRIEEKRGDLERSKSIENELQLNYVNLLNKKNELCK